MTSHNNQQLRIRLADLEEALIASKLSHDESAEQLHAANAALRSARLNVKFPWRWVSLGVIVLAVCMLGVKGDERAHVDSVLDRVVSMSRAFEQIKTICESKSTHKNAVQTILSIVAATNTTGTCLIKA